jgi:hypothetical protein
VKLPGLCMFLNWNILKIIRNINGDIVWKQIIKESKKPYWYTLERYF